MELVPWRPFGRLGSARKELDSLLNPFFRETPAMGTFTEEWLPSVDISETKKNSGYNGFWGGPRYPPKEAEMQRLCNQLS